MGEGDGCFGIVCHTSSSVFLLMVVFLGTISPHIMCVLVTLIAYLARSATRCCILYCNLMHCCSALHSTVAVLSQTFTVACLALLLLLQLSSAAEGRMRLMPHLPPSSPSQVACIPFANGVTAPSPVTTTLRCLITAGGGNLSRGMPPQS